MKKLSAFVIVFFAVLFCTSSKASAATTRYKLTSNAYVYSAANTGSLKTAKLPYGMVVKAAATPKSGSSWIKITAAGNITGYIKKSVLKKTSEAMTPFSKLLYRTKAVDGLILRSKASVNSAIVSVIPVNTIITRVKKYNSKWYKVQTAAGNVGYVSTAYITYVKIVKYSVSTPTPKPTASPTPKPTAAATVKPTAAPTATPKATAAPTASPANGTISAPTASPTASPEVTVYYIVNAESGLNLRASASYSGTLVRVLDYLETVTLVSTSKSPWYKIRTTDGTVGFVYSDYLSKIVETGSENISPSNGYPVFGIDVSEANDLIDYSKLVGKVGFVVIRCGYGSDYQSQDDDKFAYNVSQCEKYGIPYGIYLFSYAKTAKQAASEATHIKRLLTGCNPTMGIWWDLEWSSMPTDKTTINAMIEAFFSSIKTTGYKSGIYTYVSFYNSRFAGTDAENYKIWMAQYNDVLEFDKPVVAWQFTCEYTFSGLKGCFDGSRAYSSFFEHWS